MKKPFTKRMIATKRVTFEDKLDDVREVRFWYDVDVEPWEFELDLYEQSLEHNNGVLWRFASLRPPPPLAQDWFDDWGKHKGDISELDDDVLNLLRKWYALCDEHGTVFVH